MCATKTARVTYPLFNTSPLLEPPDVAGFMKPCLIASPPRDPHDAKGRVGILVVISTHEISKTVGVIKRICPLWAAKSAKDYLATFGFSSTLGTLKMASGYTATFGYVFTFQTLEVAGAAC